MPLTHIVCDFAGSGGTDGSPSEYAPEGGFAAINPGATPGSLIAAISAAGTTGISAQVAAKLSLEHFIAGTLDHYWELLAANPSHPIGMKIKPDDLSASVLEAGFRRANSSVYDFGHKLAAGGRMGASLLSIVITEGVVTTGRVGRGEALLRRGQEVFPFFSDPPAPSGSGATNGGTAGPTENHPPVEDLVGAHSKVAVEVATVPLQEYDSIILFPEELSHAQREYFCRRIRELDVTATDFAPVLQELFPRDLPRGAYIVHVGAETIFLHQRIIDHATMN